MGLDYGASSDFIAEDNKRTLAELEAIVYGNLINGDASMGLDYGASSDLIAEDNKRRLESLEAIVANHTPIPPPPTDILFGNSAITNADGTRSVVSEGTDTTAKLDLYSGQGLRFDGTQFIDTDYIPDLTKDLTLLWEQEKNDVTGWRQNGTYATNDAAFIFGLNPDGVRVGLGNEVVTVNALLNVGTVYSMFMRYNSTTKIVTAGIIDGEKSQFSTVISQILLPVTIGKLNGTASASIGAMKNIYYIPKELTDFELSSHLKNPEQTLYYDNLVLKSDLLAQSVVDSVQTGGGFWYPLCENNSLARTSFGSAADMSLKETQDIVLSSEWDAVGSSVYSVNLEERKNIILKADVGYDYLLDIEVISTNGGGLRFWAGSAGYQALSSAVGKRTVYLNITGSPPIIYNADLNNFVGTIKLSSFRKLSRITNYANSPMRDNATKQPYGLQTSLIKQDSFGLPIGVADDSELVWVDESYATQNVPLVLTGNFCIDTYVKEIGTTDSTFLSFTTETVDPILIGVAGATGNVDIAMLTEYTSTPISASGAVVSLERDGGTLKAFINNVEVSRISYSGTVTLDIVGALSATANFATGESGSLGFTKTTRTYGQRLSTYNALRAKHGV